MVSKKVPPTYEDFDFFSSLNTPDFENLKLDFFHKKVFEFLC